MPLDREKSKYASDVFEDILDSSDFNPIQFINQKFPTETSLDLLDTFLTGISSQISSLDEEISKAVQAQSKAGEQATRDIAEAQMSIRELFDKIHDIKTKASQSERMVQEICADIKKLDFAKSHLQSTITSLKRLQMLVTAVGQLELMASDFQYREVANLLDAVKQLLTHFDRYTAIPKIAEVKGRVDAIQSELKRHVHSSFREMGQLVDSVSSTDTDLNEESNTPTNPAISNKSLSEACLVVDALGPSARRDLLEEFVQLQLLPYERYFGPGKTYFNLDQVEKRWLWFKKLLKIVDNRFATIFPLGWKVPHRLCLQFITRTRHHLEAVLTASASSTSSPLSATTAYDQTGSIPGGADVNTLLKALQTTLRFEQELRVRFGTEGKSGEVDKAEAMTAENIKKKYQNQRNEAAASDTVSSNLPKLPFEVRLKRREEASLFSPSEAAMGVAEAARGVEAEEIAVLSGLASLEGNLSISAVYDDFLGPYVLLERRNLEEMLSKLAQEEDKEGARSGDSSSSGSSSKVFGSSMSMFVYIKNSIKRCTALTTGNTFLALSKEFRNCLMKYADSLRTKCPSPISSQGQLLYKVIPAAEVVPQLEAMVKAKINANLAEAVDYSKEEGAFNDVIAFGLKILSCGVLERLEPAFRSMQSLNWGGVTAVGEESAHIHQWHAVLQDTLPRIRDNALSPSYFKTFCTKLASDFLQRYLEAVMKQKKISETGTQQLQLDTYNVKTLLLHLPHQGLPPDAVAASRPTIPPAYMKLVTGRISHIEMILKLVGTPEEMLLERFQIMYIGGGIPELQAIMALKGMRKAEQTQLLESLGLAVAAAAAAEKQTQGKKGGARNIVSPGRTTSSGSGGGGQRSNAQLLPIPNIPIPLQPMNINQTSIEEAVNSMASSMNSMASSVRSLTQDMKSSADSAVGGFGSVLGRSRRS